MNATKYTISNGHFKETTRKHAVNVTIKQPEQSDSKNCTAAIIDGHIHKYPWIVIPCDTKYEATYVCLDINQQVDPLIGSGSAKKLPNRTCDREWFMINGSDKCFTVFWPDTALSFNDAQDICFAQNASMFTVEAKPLTFPRAEAIYLKEMIKAGISNEFGIVPAYL